MYGYGYRYNSGLVVGAGGGTPFTNTYSLDFDGMDDEVTTSSAIIGSDITLSYWVDCNSTYASGGAYFPASIARSDISDANNQIGGLADRGGGSQLFVRMQSYDENSANYSNYYCRGVQLAGTGWHNIVLTWNNSTKILYCYIDGVAQTWSNYGNTVTTSFLNYSTYPTTVLFENNLSIAKGASSSNFFGGLVDEVATFDRVVTPSEIATLSTSPTVDLTDLSPYGWFRNGDGDTYPTLTDNGSGENDATMVNMDAEDIVEITP
jgi:hypothetical protein